MKNKMDKDSSPFAKNDQAKIRYDLIPPIVLKELAEVLTYGANKYSDHNWQKCKDRNRYIAATMRHFESFRDGEQIDPESRLSHLAHALANISFLLYFEKINENLQA